MTTVNILNAKTHLSQLIQSVEQGEEVIIARHRRPVARLAPLAEKRGGMRLGAAAGRFSVPEDLDRDNADIARHFLNGES